MIRVTSCFGFANIGHFLLSDKIPLIEGGVLGRLLICDPADPSSPELSNYLFTSPGSISMSTRSLVKMGIVERVHKPGSRSAYFRARRGAWPAIPKAEVNRTRLIGSITSDLLEELKDVFTEKTSRLTESRDTSEFLQSGLPALVERWEAT